VPNVHPDDQSFSYADPITELIADTADDCAFAVADPAHAGTQPEPVELANPPDDRAFGVTYSADMAAVRRPHPISFDTTEPCSVTQPVDANARPNQNSNRAHDRPNGA